MLKTQKIGSQTSSRHLSLSFGLILFLCSLKCNFASKVSNERNQLHPKLSATKTYNHPNHQPLREICYSKEFRPIHLRVNQKYCKYSIMLEPLLRDKHRRDVLEIGHLLKKDLHFENCQQAELCFSCCKNGKCLEKRYCTTEWNLISNSAYIFVGILFFSKMVILGFLISTLFCSLKTRERIHDLHENLKVLAEELMIRKALENEEDDYEDECSFQNIYLEDLCDESEAYKSIIIARKAEFPDYYIGL